MSKYNRIDLIDEYDLSPVTATPGFLGRNQRLLDAAREGNLQELKRWLSRGANVHIDNDAPLRYAVVNGHQACLTELLRAGADINAAGNWSLNTAARNGDLSTLRILINEGAALNASALVHAASEGHPACITALAKAGVSIHDQNDLALRSAAQHGQTVCVKTLLNHGANVHAMNDAALRNTAKSGFIDCADILIKHGANIHAERDESLRTAITYGRGEYAQFLLNKGADLRTIHVGDIPSRLSLDAELTQSILPPSEQDRMLLSEIIAEIKAPVSLGTHSIPDIMLRLESNAWQGREPTSVQMTNGGNIIMLEGYIYEPGYEQFSASSSISLNGQILFGKDSRNVAPYSNETYATGTYENLEDAIQHIKGVCKSDRFDILPEKKSELTAQETSPHRKPLDNLLQSAKQRLGKDISTESARALVMRER